MAKAGDVANPLDSHLGYLLRRASGIVIGGLAQRLAALQLRPTEASILVLIDVNPAITQSRLGQALGVQRANMTPLIGGLVARGLIDREAIDRKSHGFHLTDAGRQITARVLAQMAEHEAQHFGGLSIADRDVLRRSLASIAGVD